MNRLAPVPVHRNPLQEPGWSLVGHVSNRGGMFAGNGDLKPDYAYGKYTWYPTATTSDFQVRFPFVAKEILFVTGDGSVWAIADYATLRSLIDARNGESEPNISFLVGSDGAVSRTIGNVLSRPEFGEDPIISIDGSYTDGIHSGRIVWAEEDWGRTNFSLTDNSLKNAHGGMNVYVRDSIYREPLQENGWYLVAHMNNEGGLFDGKGKLKPDYEYGKGTWYPIASTPDFKIEFPVVPKEIMFVTGDGSLWAITDYDRLRNLIDKKDRSSDESIDFMIGEKGVINWTIGTFLTTTDDEHDPVISIQRSCTDGDIDFHILWGEADWEGVRTELLKNDHGGMNVYVRDWGITSMPPTSAPTRAPSVFLDARGKNDSIVVDDPYADDDMVDDESDEWDLETTTLIATGTVNPEENESVPTTIEPFQTTLQSVATTIDSIATTTDPVPTSTESVPTTTVSAPTTESFPTSSSIATAASTISNSTTAENIITEPTLTSSTIVDPTTANPSITSPVTTAHTVVDHALSDPPKADPRPKSGPVKTDHTTVGATRAGPTASASSSAIGTLIPVTTPTFAPSGQQIPNSPEPAVGPTVPTILQEKVEDIPGNPLLPLIMAGLLVSLAITVFGFYASQRIKRRKRVRDAEMRGMSFEEPYVRSQDFVDVNPITDEISTLGEPVFPMCSDIGTVDKEDSVIDSMADGTVDYDYSRALSGVPLSVSSVGGTIGEITLPNGGSIAQGTIPEHETIFTDDASFEAQFSRQGSKFKDEVMDIVLPSGKLGIIIDTPDVNGPPILFAIKKSSRIGHLVRVGDRIVAVDGEDVRAMPAMKVSKLIARKANNSSRTLTIVRSIKVD